MVQFSSRPAKPFVASNLAGWMNEKKYAANQKCGNNSIFVTYVSTALFPHDRDSRATPTSLFVFWKLGPGRFPVFGAAKFSRRGQHIVFLFFFSSFISSSLPLAWLISACRYSVILKWQTLDRLIRSVTLVLVPYACNKGFASTCEIDRRDVRFWRQSLSRGKHLGFYLSNESSVLRRPKRA